MYIKKELQSKICPICKKEFLTSISKKIYCSNDCHRIIYRKLNLIRRTKTIPDYAKLRWGALRLRSEKLNKKYCTLKEFRKFWNEPHKCTYCGISEKIFKEIKGKYSLQVDKKNPKLGYTIDNIVWACRICNTMKSNILTYEEMIEIGLKYIKPKWENLTICQTTT